MERRWRVRAGGDLEEFRSGNEGNDLDVDRARQQVFPSHCRGNFRPVGAWSADNNCYVHPK